MLRASPPPPEPATSPPVPIPLPTELEKRSLASHPVTSPTQYLCRPTTSPPPVPPTPRHLAAAVAGEDRDPAAAGSAGPSLPTARDLPRRPPIGPGHPPPAGPPSLGDGCPPSPRLKGWPPASRAPPRPLRPTASPPEATRLSTRRSAPLPPDASRQSTCTPTARRFSAAGAGRGGGLSRLPKWTGGGGGREESLGSRPPEPCAWKPQPTGAHHSPTA